MPGRGTGAEIIGQRVWRMLIVTACGEVYPQPISVGPQWLWVLRCQDARGGGWGKQFSYCRRCALSQAFALPPSAHSFPQEPIKCHSLASSHPLGPKTCYPQPATRRGKMTGGRRSRGVNDRRQTKFPPVPFLPSPPPPPLPRRQTKLPDTANKELTNGLQQLQQQLFNTFEEGREMRSWN